MTWRGRAPGLVLVALAAIFRLAYLAGPVVTFDGDEATTGLMARRILHGHLYTFFAGQHYGGAIEQYLQAAALLLLPDSPTTLRLPQVLLSTGTVWLTYRVGLRMLPHRWQALLAGGLLAVGPWFEIRGSVAATGFYTAAQLLGVACLLVALRLRAGLGGSATLGLLVGLAAWTSPLTLFAVVPALLWSFRQVRPARFLPAAVVGAFPLLAAGHLPVPDGSTQPPSTIAERLGNLTGPVLREALGLTYLRDRGGLPAALHLAVGLVLLAVVLTAAWRLRHARGDVRWLLLVALPVTAGLYVASPAAWYTDTPRYLFTAMPLLALGVAAVATRRWLGAALVLAEATTCLVLVSRAGSVPARRDLEPDYLAVVAYARANHVAVVFGDSFLVYPLAWYADGSLRVVVTDGAVRFPQGGGGVHNGVSLVPSDAPVRSATRLATFGRLALDRSGYG